MFERRFDRTLGSLEGLFTFVREFLALEGLEPSQGMELELIAEELFANVVRHGGDGGPIEVSLARTGERVRLVLRHHGATAFDPTRAPAVEIEKPLEERRGGGMGLHLVRSLADEFRYENVGGEAVITVSRRLEN